MAKSILDTDKSRCYVCNRNNWIEKHHIYGASNRNKSELNGFTVYLCHYCHNEPPNGVHFNRELDLKLKRDCQKKYEETHTREEFRNLIGRSYL
jgi:hypothetical protein